MHPTQQLIPTVVENNGHWERAFDIYSMLLKNRIVFLNTPINQQVANVVVAQLLYLNGESPQEPVHLYISSPGGDVYAGLAIYDTMQMIAPPIYTYAVGMTASMGTALLAAGAPGHRYALPHATIHMHPSSSGAQGYTEDVRIAFRELERVQTQIFHLVGKHTGHSWQEIEAFFQRDRFLHAIEAKEYGIVDHILGDASNIILWRRNDEIELAGLPLPTQA
ncbi:MAG: ATP-dependent Clp protease proteolytic subunit [Caldilineaceae bacterium]|nr:ATP-dependent Clp protease proteolytic subunit [Caldilineaceae bacterium]